MVGKDAMRKGRKGDMASLRRLVNDVLLLLVVLRRLIIKRPSRQAFHVGPPRANLLVRLRGANRIRLAVHLVDFLQTETLGLKDEEVGKDGTSGARAGPDEENLGKQVGADLSIARGVDEVGRRVTEGKVPEPVRCCAHRESLGANGEREDFAADDPRSRTPGGSETSNVEADECDDGTSGSRIGSCTTVGVGAGLAVKQSGADAANNQLADHHPNGAIDEQVTATDALHPVHARQGHEHVDDVGGDREEERVALGRDGRGEEARAVVEDEVDTGQLLPRLKEDARHGTRKVLALAKLEAVGVRASSVGEFNLQVGLNVGQFGTDQRVIEVRRVEATQ